MRLLVELLGVAMPPPIYIYQGERDGVMLYQVCKQIAELTDGFLLVQDPDGTYWIVGVRDQQWTPEYGWGEIFYPYESQRLYDISAVRALVSEWRAK